jgi:hypothetical protein
MKINIQISAFCMHKVTLGVIRNNKSAHIINVQHQHCNYVCVGTELMRISLLHIIYIQQSALLPLAREMLYILDDLRNFSGWKPSAERDAAAVAYFKIHHTRRSQVQKSH